MKVHWTETAERHLDAIYGFIAQDSTTYALRTVDRITRKSQQIGDYVWASGPRIRHGADQRSFCWALQNHLSHKIGPN